MKRTTELSGVWAPRNVIMETIRERLIENKFQIREFRRGEGKVLASRGRIRQLVIGNIRSVDVEFRSSDEPAIYQLSMSTSNFIFPASHSALTLSFIPAFLIPRASYYFFPVVLLTAIVGSGLNITLGVLLYRRFWKQMLEDISLLSLEYEKRSGSGKRATKI